MRLYKWLVQLRVGQNSVDVDWKGVTFFYETAGVNFHQKNFKLFKLSYAVNKKLPDADLNDFAIRLAVIEIGFPQRTIV